jgi:hypothetical protein
VRAGHVSVTSNVHPELVRSLGTSVLSLRACPNRPDSSRAQWTLPRGARTVYQLGIRKDDGREPSPVRVRIFESVKVETLGHIHAVHHGRQNVCPHLEARKTEGGHELRRASGGGSRVRPPGISKLAPVLNRQTELAFSADVCQTNGSRAEDKWGVSTDRVTVRCT